jgi:uncharacterized protein
VSRRVPVTLVVMAKRPRPGAVKTRLCPPCTPHEAARLAAAALDDTLGNVRSARVAHRVLAIDDPDSFTAPGGFRVVGQVAGGLDARLAAAAVDAKGPVLLIGMDTPQADATVLDTAAATLLAPGIDAVLGLAADGGYWAIGLRDPRPEHFLGIPMSRAHTGAAQLARLRAWGAHVALLPELRDVDEFVDARAVADLAPDTAFAAAFSALEAAR